MHNQLKVAVLKQWRGAMLASAAISLTACMAGPSQDSSSSAQVESSSESVVSSSSVAPSSSSIAVSSSSAAPVVSSSSSSVVSSIAQSSSSESAELGAIVPRTSCPSAPPASKSVDLESEGPYDLTISKSEIEAMLTKMPTFDGSQWDLPWHMWEPSQADTSSELFPLIVSLHGAWAAEAGGNEDGPGNILEDGAPYMLGSSNGLLTPENKEKYPAYMIFPHCLESEGCHYNLGNEWAANSGANFQLGNSPSRVMSSVLELIQHMIDNYNVDPARIYVTGISMGGGGTWDMLSRHPELLAAAVPVAGHTPALSQLNKAIESKLPVWAHGGEQDFTNNFVNDTVGAINKVSGDGGCAWSTGYNDYRRGDQWSMMAHGHTLWQRAYLNPDLWPWLFAQKQPREGDAPATGQSSSAASSSAPSNNQGAGCNGADYCNDFNSVNSVPSGLNPLDGGSYSVVSGRDGDGIKIDSSGYNGAWVMAPGTDQMTSGYVKFDAKVNGPNSGLRWYLIIENEGSPTSSFDPDWASRLRIENFDGSSWIAWNRLKTPTGSPDTVAPNYYAPNERSLSSTLNYDEWVCYELYFNEAEDLIELSMDGVKISGLTLDSDYSTQGDTRWLNDHPDNSYDVDVKSIRMGFGGSPGSMVLDNLVVSSNPIGCN